MPAATQVVCRRTDLPKQQRRPTQEAVRVLYDRLVKKDEAKKRTTAARWGELAESLKASLDQSFKPHWHVLVGKQLGFACKKRDQTMGVWRVNDEMVVIWKSPGIELPASAAGPAAADDVAQGADAAAAGASTGSDTAPDGAEASKPEAPSGDAGATLRVLQPTVVEAGSEVERTVALLREELAGARGQDVQQLAQNVRKRLTEELGPIWHVAAGTEFGVAAAADARNFVLVVAGKTRVVCWQHEQFTGGGGIDFKKVLKALPYLFFALFCFSFMTLANMCQGTASPPTMRLTIMVRDTFCTEGWEQEFGKLGAAAMGLLFLARKADYFFPKT